MKQFELWVAHYNRTDDEEVQEIIKNQMYGYIRALKDMGYSTSALENKYKNLD